MQETVPNERGNGSRLNETSVSRAVEQVVTATRSLVGHEIRLFRTDMAELVRHKAGGAVWIAVAAGLGLLGYLGVVACLTVLAIAWLNLWAGFLVIGAAHLVIAGIVAVAGASYARKNPLREDASLLLPPPFDRRATEHQEHLQ